MTIKLNVLITNTDKGKIFSVWSDSINELPWISLYEGHGNNLSEAVDDYYFNLPDNIVIDDETLIHPTDIKYLFKRPFKINTSNHTRIFKLN